MKRLVELLTARTARANGMALAAVAVVVAAALGLLGEMGVAHVMRFGHDDFIFLDGGWRVFSGQRPHVDFHTPLGLVTPVLIGLAMKVGRPDATALGTAVILFVAVTTAWAWGVAQKRLAPALGAAFALLVAATGVGQYTLSFDYLETSHASLFNRFGYAVLVVLLVECLVPPKDLGRRGEALGGASSGAALAVLFFIKPSFVLQGVVLLALSAVVLPRTRARWIGVAAGAAVATVALLAVAGTTPAAVLADYASGLASRTSGLSSNEQTTVFLEMSRRDSFSMTPAKILEILKNDFWSLLAVVALAALVPAPAPGLAARFASRRAVFAGLAILLLSSLPIVFTNWQWGEVPTTPALAIVLAELALRDAAALAARPLAPAAIAALVLFAWSQVAVKSFGSVLAAWSWHQTIAPAMPPDARFAAPPIKDLVVMRSDGYCRPNQYAQKVNEGLGLLAASGAASPKILVADFSNPFSIALHAPPAKGGELWWHLGATFNPTHAPSAAEALADVDVVMIPKCPEEPPTRDAILALYGPAIDAQFTKTNESTSWALFQRKH